MFYPQALYNNLVFELTLAPAGQVVNGSDTTKLGYKLENIKLEYEVILSKTLAVEAVSTYNSGKEFRVRPRHAFRGGAHYTRLDHPLHCSGEPPAQVRSRASCFCSSTPTIQGLGTLNTTLNPDITKVRVTVNGVPSRVYNDGISGKDMWNEITRHFKPHSGGSPNMTLTKYLTANKFGLWVDLRSMADTTMHGNGQRLVNTQDGVQLEIDRKASGSGTTNCPHLRRL